MSIEYVNDPSFFRSIRDGITRDEYMDALRAGYYRNNTALLGSVVCVNVHAHDAYFRIMINVDMLLEWPDADITPQYTWLEYIE